MYCEKKIGNTTSRIELGSVIVSSGAILLLSLTALMRLGWQLNGNKPSLILRDGNKQIKFQHQVKIDKGLLFVLRIIRDKSDELANPSVKETTEALNTEKYSTKAIAPKKQIYIMKREKRRNQRKQETQSLERLVK